MTIKDIQLLAETHGLLLTENIKFNEMGIDFRVGIAIDTNGQSWLLRIPRRADMWEQIEQEKRILALVKNHLSVQVPDWQISTAELVAYPLLKDNPVLTFDAKTYAVHWHMDQNSPEYVNSLAKILVELHSIPTIEVAKSAIKIKNPSKLRSEIATHIDLVKSEIGLPEELEGRYRRWIDQDVLWADFCQLIHGDLYAGHILASAEGIVSGIIDWTTAHVGDPALDFSGHLTVFGEKSLKLLIKEYENQGGRVWDKLFEQTIERAAAAPLAYAVFALETQDPKHIAGAKSQLGIK